MTELKTITALVKQVLEDFPKARADDDYLYLRVLDHIAYENGTFLAGMPVPYFLENRKDLGLPPFESVRRSRQKVQAECPHLMNDKARAKREQMEKVYREYARGSGF